jgi:uncharacterized GH25 family protein
MQQSKGAGMRMREDKLSLMARGHEIWLENFKIEDRDVELAIVYGHNMRQDGLGDLKRLEPFVYAPDGTKFKPELIPGEDRHLLRFQADIDGWYTAVVDMGSIIISQTKEGYELGPRHQFKDVIYAGAFHQMAKKMITVGDPDGFKSELVHGILEIVPAEPFCRVGQETELRVYYEGDPLPMAEIKAVSRNEGKEMASVKTDEQGRARVPVPSSGEWMYLARHRDPSKKVSEEFDESVFVTTLVMEAK